MSNKKRVAAWGFVLAAFFAVPGAAAASFSDTPADTYITNGSVYTVKKAGDAVYLGGDFTTVGPNTGSGVPVDAGTAVAAATYPKITGRVIASIADGEGGWYIGGSFTKVGSNSVHGLAHILANGSADADFDAAINTGGVVYVLALSPDGGTLYAGGYYNEIGGEDRSNIAALDADTGAAVDWDPDADDPILALAFSPDGGTLYAGGSFTNIGGANRGYIAALDVDATSSIATDWDPTADEYVRALAVSSDGATVYAGGDFTNIGGEDRGYIAAINATSSEAIDWDPDADDEVYALKLSSDDSTLYVSGYFSSIGGESRNFIGALDTASGNATAFNPDADKVVYTLALSPDNDTVYAGGDFTNIGGEDRVNVAALDAGDGAAIAWDPKLVVTPASEGPATVYALAVSADGAMVYVGGDFWGVGGVDRNYLAAFDTETGEVTDWDPNVSGGDYPSVYKLIVSPDNSTIYVGGQFTAIGGRPRNNIAALDAEAGAATDWDPDASGDYAGVEALVFSPDAGTIYVGGQFTAIGGKSRNNIAALDAETGEATDWDPDAANSVLTLALSPDGGTVYAGGYFGSIGGQSRAGIAALDAETGKATAWNPAPEAGWDAYVESLAVSLDGDVVYAAGYFDTIGGESRKGLAALDANATSSIATDWDSDADDYSRFVAISSDGGTLYVGGQFTAIGGKPRNNFAALDAETGAATDWDPNLDKSATSIDVASDGGTLYVGGFYTTASGLAQPYFAQFIDPDVVLNEDEENNAPVFSGIDNTSGKIVRGDEVTFSAAASDPDDDQITLYICKSNDFADGACGDAGEWCHSGAAAADPSCDYEVRYSDGTDSHTYYAYIVDAEGLGSASNPRSGTFETKSSSSSGGSSGGGSSNSGGQYDMAALRQKIDSLKSEIARITALLLGRGAVLAPNATTTVDVIGSNATSTAELGCTIDKNLYRGMVNEPQVKCLQQFLAGQGFAVIATGTFGVITRDAVVAFQEKYAADILASAGKTKGTGFVGFYTLRKIGQIAGWK